MRKNFQLKSVVWTLAVRGIYFLEWDILGESLEHSRSMESLSQFFKVGWVRGGTLSRFSGQSLDFNFTPIRLCPMPRSFGP